MSNLIKDTTREQREQIVKDALGYLDSCDSFGQEMLMDMYQPYIDGQLEISQVNARYQSGYCRDYPQEEKNTGCIQERK